MASKTKLALPPPTPWQRLTRMLDTERETIRYIFYYAVVTGLISLSLPLGTQAVFNMVSTGAIFSNTYILIGVVVLGVLLGGIRAPILASTLEALGYDPAELEGGPHEDWIIHGEHVPAQDIAAEHLRWYAQHPSVVAAGLRRHEHLIQRLGLSA